MTLFGLYTFFYLVVELAINDYAEPVVGSANITMLYGISYIVVAAGYPLYFLMLRAVKKHTLQRATTLCAAVLGAASFLVVSFTTLPALLVVCTLVSHLTSGYIGGAVYYYAAMRMRGYGRIGLAIGVVCAGANAVQMVCITALSLLSVSAGLWVERVILLLALAGVALYIITRVPAVQQTGTKVEKTPASIHKYVLGGLVAVAILAILHGINDGVITTLHAASDDFIVYGYPRLFVIPGLLLAGAVSDLRDRRFFPYATLVAMLTGTVAVLLFSSPETYNIGTSFIYFFFSFMTLFSIVPFMEWAPSTAGPALTAVAGRSVRYAFSGLAIIVGGILFASASMVALLVLFVVFLAGLFTVFFFMGQLHLPPRKNVNEPRPCQLFADKYSLTERETDVLEVILQGVTVSDISHQLFISEITVKRHVSNILKKTDTKNRAELIDKYLK